MIRIARLAVFAMLPCIAAVALAAGEPPKSDVSGCDPTEALRRLQMGSARFLCGKPDHPRADAERRFETATGGQHPFAIVLACADSRVPVEVIFDQGVGDLFTIRVAGNVADPAEIGSIEYATEHLGTPLVVVMGHRACGAVKAVCSKGEAHGNLAAVLDGIKPAVDRTEKARPDLTGDGLLSEAVKANVFWQMETLLTKSPSVAKAVRTDKLDVVGAVYDIETGTIQWLGAHPDEAKLATGAGESAAKENPENEKQQPGKTAVAGAQATNPPKPGEDKKPKQPANPPGGSGHP